MTTRPGGSCRVWVGSSYDLPGGVEVNPHAPLPWLGGEEIVTLDLTDGPFLPEDKAADPAYPDVKPSLRQWLRKSSLSHQAPRSAAARRGVGEFPNSFQPFSRTDFREGGQ